MTKAARIMPEPRGLRREQAAVYVGVSPSSFDRMVANGTMPQPKKIGGTVIWCRHALDAAFDALPDRPERNSWDAANEDQADVRL